MCNCPKCNYKLPFFQVGFLSRARPSLVCKKCNTRLEATDKLKLGIYGGIGGAISALLFISALQHMRTLNTAGIIELILGFAVLFVVGNFQYNSLKFNISNDQSNVDEGEVVQAPSHNDRIPFMKHKFGNKSNDELSRIIHSEDYTDEAKLAAQELLKERNN